MSRGWKSKWSVIVLFYVGGGDTHLEDLFTYPRAAGCTSINFVVLRRLLAGKSVSDIDDEAAEFVSARLHSQSLTRTKATRRIFQKVIAFDGFYRLDFWKERILKRDEFGCRLQMLCAAVRLGVLVYFRKSDNM